MLFDAIVTTDVPFAGTNSGYDKRRAVGVTETQLQATSDKLSAAGIYSI